MNPALWIARKEIRELLRDRRVIIGALLMPVLMIWLIVGVFGRLESAFKGGPALSIAQVGGERSPFADEIMKKARGKIEYFDTEDAAKKSLKSGDSNLVIISSTEADPTKPQDLRVIFDSQSPLSGAALAAYTQAVAKMNQNRVKQIFDEKGIDPEQAEMIRLKPEDVRKGTTPASSSWLGMLPYLVVLWAFYGGFSIASDMIAGEKERGTLETLLATPAHRHQVVTGKWLALSLFCFLSSVTSLCGLLLASLMGMSGAAGLTGPSGLHLTTLAGFIAILVPLVLMFSSLLLAITSHARSVREAQTYLTVVSFLVLMPAMMSQFVGLTGDDKAAWVQWTPVLNSALAMGGALKDSVDISLVTRSICINLVLATIFLFVSYQKFKKESILAKT